MQTKYKIIILICILFFTLFSALLYLPQILEKTVKKDIENKNFKSAAIKYTVIASMSDDPIKKGGAYYILGDCYLELKNLNKAIKSYEKAENTLLIGDDYAKKRLTDLYIITGNSAKAAQRNALYKICAVMGDWDCALNDLNKQIENPKIATMIGNKIYADSELYLARAIVYRNLNNEALAKEDLNNAIITAPEKAKELIEIFQNKNFYHDYYKHLKEVFQ